MLPQKERQILTLLFGVCFCVGTAFTVKAQNGLSPSGYTTYYRLPYHQYRWQRYQTSFAQIFYPKDLDSVCRFTLEYFPRIKKQMEQNSGLSLQGIPSLIIYPSVTQAYASRIGGNESMPNTFPTITTKGHRIILGFEGSYERFTEQLQLACVRSMWQHTFNPGSQTNLAPTYDPDLRWFQEGAIRYLARGFSLADYGALHQLFEAKNLQRWTQLAEGNSETQALAMQGFCYFLAQRYRKDAVKQVVFQIKRKKSLATALRLVCKRDMAYLQQAYIDFLYTAFQVEPIPAIPPEDSVMTPKPMYRSTLDSVQRQEGINQVSYTKDSSSIVFVQHKDQQRTVWLLQGGKRHKLYTYNTPPWINTPYFDAYPLVTLDGQDIYIVSVWHGQSVVYRYTTSGTRIATTLLPKGIDGVSSFIPKNATEWWLTAYTKGRSDLVMFHTASLRLKPLTDDLADNDQLRLSLADAGIPENKQLIFYHSGYPGIPVEDTAHEHPKGKAYGWYGIDRSGSTKEEQFLRSDSVVFAQALDGLNKREAMVPDYQRYWLEAYLRRKKSEDSLAVLEEKYRAADRATPSFLQGALNYGKDTAALTAQDESVFSKEKVQPYILQLNSLWFNAGLNNDYFINRLQPYQGYLGTYKFPEIGGIFSSGYSDIFEQHQFNIGYKLPAGTEGSDFFARYRNLCKRLDWSLLYYRKVESLKPDPKQVWVDARGMPYPATAKVKTYYYELGLSYPFNYYTGLSFTSAIRQGRTVFLATDQYSLPYPALPETWNINSLSVQYNRLQATRKNPFFYKGIRNKILLDGMMSIGKQQQLTYAISNAFEWHQPLHPSVNWVTVLKLGYSGGDKKVLYNFGGMDNNVIVRVDSTVLFKQQAPYAFQQLVTQLRGFEQNSLYGNVFGLLNTDISVQVFDGLFDYKTPYRFINRIQLGAFADVALAKETWNPAAIWQHRNSFGLSMKTVFASYPVRLDLAFPYNFSHKPMLQFSLRL
ncbi:hypothetical protein DBR32_10390 [Taibaiella sp. KBW10]|uniref:hypothetical protein n=1 Tax=Taibaiella sp. KBW10 TaxID=2153357 RepID=UPI000F5A080E|nr:hypothetical protein [Taibaiella sp. KBW10]RQO31104.1 hypothetical protein DBR32_10390 [Taibaiella sp. KBW10]